MKFDVTKCAGFGIMPGSEVPKKYITEVIEQRTRLQHDRLVSAWLYATAKNHPVVCLRMTVGQQLAEHMEDAFRVATMTGEKLDDKVVQWLVDEFFADYCARNSFQDTTAVRQEIFQDLKDFMWLHADRLTMLTPNQVAA